MFTHAITRFQWRGTIRSANVIEFGSGWINAYVIAENVNPALYPIIKLQTIVNKGNLPLFAVSDDEKLFLRANQVTLLSTPLFGVGESGYNSGNYLIGLESFWIILLITLC